MSDFHSYAHAQYAYFQKHSRRTVYKKGQLLVRREEQSPWMFFIESGYVKMMFTNETGEERVLGFGLPGMAIAQSGSFYTLPHFELEYAAHTDCIVWRIPRDDFIAAMRADSILFGEWHERILQNHNMLVERVLYLGERNPKARVLAWLLGMARYYSVVQRDGSILVEIPMTQDIIASFTGLSRESTNRVFAELRAANLVRIQRHHLIIPRLDSLHT